MDPIIVGIDVSKDHLDIHVRPSGEAFAVARDASGIAALVDRLAPLNAKAVGSRLPAASKRWLRPTWARPACR